MSIIGITGAIGGLLVQKLRAYGDTVHGPVRREDRPSLLTDDMGSDAVSLGPAGFHGQISRQDVATTLVALLHEARIGRQILEVNTGSTQIDEAVRDNVR